MKKPDITNKAERHAIYVLALAEYRRNIRQNWLSGLCLAIKSACGHLEDELAKKNKVEFWEIDSYPNPYHNMGSFPEIVMHRPLDYEKSNYWFPPLTKEGQEKRIEILKQAIKETE